MKQRTGSVWFEKADFAAATESGAPLLGEEIKGALCLTYALSAGQALHLGGREDCIRIFFLLEGAIDFISGGRSHSFDERAFFAPDPAKALGICAATDSRLLELDWAITEKDADIMASFREIAPFAQVYAKAALYDDDSKSAKTLSRSILLQHILPRICIGSVETSGFDRVEPHDHPHIDQFFYTFGENDMDLLVGAERHPMGGDTLLHIPIGSMHGAEVAPGKKMHYIWIDFVMDDEGLSYLDGTHRLRSAK